jgi:hypothetical protein
MKNGEGSDERSSIESYVPVQYGVCGGYHNFVEFEGARFSVNWYEGLPLLPPSEGDVVEIIIEDA